MKKPEPEWLTTMLHTASTKYRIIIESTAYEDGRIVLIFLPAILIPNKLS